MPFVARETVLGLQHWCLGMSRRLLKQSPTNYVEARAIAGGVRPATTIHGELEVCSICGFALVEINLEGEWTLTTCSALDVIPWARYVKELRSAGPSTFRQWVSCLRNRIKSELPAKTSSSVRTSEVAGTDGGDR